MTLEYLQQNRSLLLLECISGSKAYNLELPTSDTDLKGVFVLPRKTLYGMTYTAQVANEKNDEIYYEVKRFLELLEKNNPNILELLSTPQHCIRFRHPLMNLIKPSDFLSKLCQDTFAGYASAQIKKARGLNKKINQSFPEKRKNIIEFCYVVDGLQTKPLVTWLESKGYEQSDCGLARLDHFRDLYALFHNSQFPDVSFKGIYSGDEANDVQLSSIPKGIIPLVILEFNKDAYSVYCKDFASYHEWVAKRNEARYAHNKQLGADYDSKHMMHTYRLLTMAEEIALYKEVRVWRDDRDFLLRIRNGEFSYEQLLEMVEEKMTNMTRLYAESDLPASPDPTLTEQILVRIREEFYV
ncbi:nucleotidyltransferase [Chitinophaga silvatica]|uniref:Nucleotidyltransferase n=1 Tax=Chitinophaga silvatica TaxID=2282649 RepID=A0A3E1Y3D7_9BACT|nr:nucleotidyltransferase domain-containing protein [Chitinophaga silvatica]RFS19205.1 nucleotidyltransferase [Chitinophaga silvatica]